MLQGRLWNFACAVAIGGTLVACGGSDPTSSKGADVNSRGRDAGAGSDASKSSKDPVMSTTDGGTTPTSDPGRDGGVTEATCAAGKTIDDCTFCCSDVHPACGVAKAAAFKQCACAAGTCMTQCANSYCKDSDPVVGDACDMCLLAQDDKCGAASTTAAAGNAECTARDACAASACAGKPEGEGDAPSGN